MPVVMVVTNARCSMDVKKQLCATLCVSFAEEIKCPPGHVHIHILDEQCFAFGGDLDTPCAYITVKSSAAQIHPEVRKILVERMAPVLHSSLGTPPERTTTLFEELPVEQIAVGTSIAVFAKSPRASMSPHESKGAHAFTSPVSPTRAMA